MASIIKARVFATGWGMSLAVIALGINLIFYRGLSRISIFIPARGFIDQIIQHLVDLGWYAALFASWILPAVVLLSWWQGSRRRWFWVEGLLALAVVVLAMAGPATVRMVQLTVAYETIALVLLIRVGITGYRLGRPAVGVAATAASASFAVSLIDNLYRWQGTTHTQSLALVGLQLAELLVLTSAVLLLWEVWRSGCKPLRLKRVLLASSLSVGLIAAFTLHPSPTAIIALWGLGLTMQFPLAFYILALWCFVLGLSTLLAERSGLRSQGWSWMLIALAGISMPLLVDSLAILAGFGSLYQTIKRANH